MGSAPHPASFSWRGYLSAIWTRSLKISAAVLAILSAFDFIASRVKIGVPSLSAQSSLGVFWFIGLLLLIVLVAALAEALERLGAVPITIPVFKWKWSVASLATYSVLTVGLTAIYAGSYFARPVVVVAAPAPSPAPTPAFEWTRDLNVQDIGVSESRWFLDKPIVNVHYMNPGNADEKVRFFYRIRTALVYTGALTYLNLNVLGNLHAIVVDEIAQNPEPGFTIKPGSHRMITLAGSKLSQVEINRYDAQMDGIYFDIYAAVNLGSNRRLWESCGLEILMTAVHTCN